jgi:hypothetical protein
MKNGKTNAGSFATAKLQVIIAIAMITVIAFSFAACGGDDDGGGGGGGGGGPSTFTLTGIPAKYNGRSPTLVAGSGSLKVFGIYGTISNGTVIIDLQLDDKDSHYPAYTGNDTLQVSVTIGSTNGVMFNSVKFSNGSATRAWSAADISSE